MLSPQNFQHKSTPHFLYRTKPFSVFETKNTWVYLNLCQGNINIGIQNNYVVMFKNILIREYAWYKNIILLVTHTRRVFSHPARYK